MGEPLFRDPRRWRELEAYYTKMLSGLDRCNQVAQGEKVMGFEESWLTYVDMMAEIRESYEWLAKEGLP